VQKETIRSKYGYEIPCLNNICGNEKKVVLVSHGLGSSKESATVEAVFGRFPAHGIGGFAFDFPDHGESKAGFEHFRIENCMEDLAAAERHVGDLLPEAEIFYFSSSFGAYINLLYLANKLHVGQKSFLRCAAVDLPGIFRRNTGPQEAEALENKGHFTLNYGRPLSISKGFMEDLERFDVFSQNGFGAVKIAMVHGDLDETASLADAYRFAETYGVPLTVVEGGDHQFTNPGGMEAVLDTALSFYLSE